MQDEIKRLFFGIEVHAPWPSHLPAGRQLDQQHRHFTLAFLGNIPYAPLQDILKGFPREIATMGTVGYFDHCLLLPQKHPNVVAWHANWLDPAHAILETQQIVAHWLSKYYALDKRTWLPHVTLSRQPFDSEAWMKAFKPLPFFTSSLHLYESKGNLSYIPIWTFPIQVPFEEISHTADLAFLINGKTLAQLYTHAFTALAFKFPPLLKSFLSIHSPNSLDDLIIALNRIISHADQTVGCPMKAVSFHGEVIRGNEDNLQWEMIIDV